MTERIDLVYDRLVADEKLKSGTKYERLAAIVFRILTERTTVHDLKLRGEVGVAHQIDAVVGEGRTRILIEAKDYDKKVDLPVVRNFSAVVDDLRPDEAFVVTTVGFSDNAQRWAKAQGIEIEKSDGAPVKADATNGELTSAGAYNKLGQKSITAWLGLRNSAAHGKYDEYDHRQVASLIQGIRDFMVRHPA